MFDYPPLYDGEILYSMILRYHRFSGNISFRESVSELYGKEKGIYSLLFPNEIILILNKLEITKESFIEEHSIFPYYRLFMTEDKYLQAVDRMIYSDRIYANYLVSSKICDSNNYIKYCPICILERDGDIIFKCNEQIDFVHVCHFHKCYLNYYNFKYRRLFQPIQRKDMNLEVRFPEQGRDDLEYLIAKEVNDLFQAKIELEVNGLRDCLRKRIKEIGFYSSRGRLFESANEELKNYFCQYENIPYEIIEKLTFERLAGIRRPRAIHPIEYLLIIQFLYGNIENLVQAIKKNTV